MRYFRYWRMRLAAWLAIRSGLCACLDTRNARFVEEVNAGKHRGIGQHRFPKYQGRCFLEV